MDSSYALARNVAGTKFEDLPAEVVAATKNSILDTIGVILAASTLGEDGVKEIIDLVKRGGGQEESSIIGFGGKVVSWMAAFANGAMSHQLDYDDTHDATLVHPGGATVPAACAIAEKRGNISGKEFITAVAVGYDVACRLGLPLTRSQSEYSWTQNASFGKFGAVATAGKLLGLNEEELVSGFGLVLNQASVTRQASHAGGSSVRAIRDAFVAQAGVLSALMAQKGIKGDRDCLEGKYGLYNTCWLGDSDSAKVTARLGKRFMGLDVSIKPWPSCRSTHSFIEAALDLVREHDIVPEEVREIIVVRGVRSQESAEKQPKTSVDARFSLPFVLGIAIARRRVGLGDFAPRELGDPVVLGLSRRVTYRFEEKFKTTGIQHGLVEIITEDRGKYSSKEVTYPYGHPKNPMTNGDLIAKFKDCARYAVNRLSAERTDEIVRAIGGLEDVRDVSQVVQLLA